MCNNRSIRAELELLTRCQLNNVPSGSVKSVTCSILCGLTDDELEVIAVSRSIIIVEVDNDLTNELAVSLLVSYLLSLSVSFVESNRSKITRFNCVLNRCNVSCKSRLNSNVEVLYVVSYTNLDSRCKSGSISGSAENILCCIQVYTLVESICNSVLVCTELTVKNGRCLYRIAEVVGLCTEISRSSCGNRNCKSCYEQHCDCNNNFLHKSFPHFHFFIGNLLKL